MAYADYEYYLNTYGGRAVGPDDFPRLSQQASAYIDGITQGRSKTASGDDLEAVKMAMCALTDVFLDEDIMNATAFSGEAKLSSETAGRWTKSYSTKSVGGTEVDLIEKRKKDALMTWLGSTDLLKSRGYYAKECWF